MAANKVQNVLIMDGLYVTDSVRNIDLQVTDKKTMLYFATGNSDPLIGNLNLKFKGSLADAVIYDNDGFSNGIDEDDVENVFPVKDKLLMYSGKFKLYIVVPSDYPA